MYPWAFSFGFLTIETKTIEAAVQSSLRAALSLLPECKSIAFSFVSLLIGS